MIATLVLWQVAAAMPLLEQGRFADAVPLLENACTRQEVNGCYLLGRTLFTLDQYEKARTVLTPLIGSDRDPWRIHDALGAVEEAMRRPAEAEKHYRDAVGGNRDRSPVPRYHFGRFLVREGRPEDAITILKPAVAKFPADQLVRFELGRALYQSGRMGEAEAQLKSAPSLEEARRLLQKLLRQSGR